MKVPEKYRLKNHATLGSDESYGNNGFFIVPHPKISLYYLQMMASDGSGWEHVSVSLIKDVGLAGKKKYRGVDRCPTWEEMCFVKSLFWNDEEAVMELHPPKSQWISNHAYCLHLWRPMNEAIPLPEQIMVGLPALNTQENKTA